MKITNVYLKNFSAIYTAMGLTEISVNLNNINKILLMLGGNGSCKTFIMSHAQPFLGTNNDERENEFIDVDGKKVVCIKNGVDEYKCTLLYGKSNKCYIEKNGIELNPNGGVKSYESIVHSELGLTKDLFKILRIGSNVTNLINLNSSDRKKYINNFIPNVDSYLEKHKIVNTKCLEMNKELKIIGNRLSELGQREEIETELATANTNKLNLNDMKENYIKNKAIYTHELEKLENQLKESSLTESVLNDKKILSSNMEKEIVSLFESNSDTINKHMTEVSVDQFTNLLDNILSGEINEAKTKLDENSLEKKEVTRDIHTYEGEKSNYKKELVALEFKMEDYKIVDDKDKLINAIDTIKNIKVNYAAHKKHIEDSLKNIKLAEIDGMDLELLREDTFKIENLLHNYLSNLDSITIQESQKELVEDLISKLKIRIEEGEYKDIDFKEAFLMDLTQKINELLNLLSQKPNQITEKEKEKYLLESNLDKFKLYKNRHSGCNFEDCSFIKDLVQYKNLDSDILQCEMEIQKLIIERDELDKNFKILDSISDMFKLSNSTYNELKKFKYVFDKELDIVDLSTDGLKIIVKELITEMRIVKIFVSSKTNIQAEEANYKALNKELELILKLEKSKLALEKEIETTQNKLEDSTKNLDNANNKYDELFEIAKNLKLEILEKEKIKDDITCLLDRLLKRDALLEELQKYEDILNGMKTNRDFLSGIEDMIVKINKELADKEKSIIDINNKLYNINSLDERKKAIEEDYSIYEMVRDSLSPIKGIPLVFIGKYLNDIETKANELLDINFKGDFRIQFNLTDKDFFITVLRSNGNNLEDVKAASQGEMSSVSVALSLAMIKQSIDKFNIVYLDEIDGPLDMEKRRNFINIINQMIDELNLEQVFIVSHNNEFDSQEVDLVLLKQAAIDTSIPDYKNVYKDFLSNKNILFDINNIK